MNEYKYLPIYYENVPGIYIEFSMGLSLYVNTYSIYIYVTVDI